MAVKDYSTDADLNTTISGINIAEGCAPSGINDAIRQLMADVKEESAALSQSVEQAVEQAGSDAESKVSALNTALRKLIAEEVAKYLPLTGGTMTGTLVGTSYDQMCSSIDQGVTPSENQYGSSIRFLDKNKVPVGRMTAFRRAGGTTVLRLTSVLPDGENGTHLDILTGDGVRSVQLGGNSLLTSAGGNLNGELKFNTAEQGGINAILVNRDNGYAQICGGSAWANGAVCSLHGKTYTSKPGWVEIRATDGTKSASLVLKPDGSLLRSGDKVYSASNGLLLNSSNVVVFYCSASSDWTAPAGGTWRYLICGEFNAENICGTVAGGTKVDWTNGHPAQGIAIRIA